MSKSENEGDKPFEATQKKLENARKKGEIVRSQDALALASVIGFTISLQFILENQFQVFTYISSEFLSNEIAISFSEQGALKYTLGTLSLVMKIFLPPIFLTCAFLLAFRQITFAAQKITPKLEKISLISGLKKKFGLSALMEFLKGNAKLTFFFLLLYFVLIERHLLQPYIMLFHHKFEFSSLFIDVALKIFFGMVCIYFLFTILDTAWQMHQHAQKNRMSQEEVKEEHKNEEGDETLRQKRRARAEDIATNRMLLDVPKATVVITNPTHYAVALKWGGGKGEVPRCVARGSDETARKIRELAVQAGVPLYRDPPTARALFAEMKVGALIAENHFKAVAAAVAYARRIEGMVSQ